MENFQTLGLPAALLHSLNEMQFHQPTPIQAETIPPALLGRDILGSAQTGTGKTGAYGIPLVAHLLNKPQSHALVLTPTRELAMQVLTTLKQLLGRRTPIRSALLIGGDSMVKQLAQLKSKPQLIVGTPGRINDHLLRGTLNLNQTNFLVLDETDRMLDMGFSIQLQKIAKYLPEQRQTLMFSATLPNNIENLAARYLKDAVRVSVGSTTTPIEKIKQEIVRTSEAEKLPLLLDRLDQAEGSFIVFVKTKSSTERLAHKLRHSGHEAEAIHGDLRQRQREQVIRAFRNRRNRILVATDIAARGLDIPHIEYVVNYDLPQCPEDYIHRIGRTGRAGAEGTAISLITSQDHEKWRNICKLINPNEAKNERHTHNNSAPGKKKFNPKKRFGGFKKSGDGFKKSGDGFKKSGDATGKPHSSRPQQRRPGSGPKRKPQQAAQS